VRKPESSTYHLRKFAEYHKLKSIDGIMFLKDLKEKREDYVILFKNKPSVSAFIACSPLVFHHIAAMVLFWFFWFDYGCTHSNSCRTGGCMPLCT